MENSLLSMGFYDCHVYVMLCDKSQIYVDLYQMFGMWDINLHLFDVVEETCGHCALQRYSLLNDILERANISSIWFFKSWQCCSKFFKLIECIRIILSRELRTSCYFKKFVVIHSNSKETYADQKRNSILINYTLVTIAKPGKLSYPIRSSNWKKWANGRNHQRLLHQQFIGTMGEKHLCQPLNIVGCWWCPVLETICRLIVRRTHLNFRLLSLGSSILITSTKKRHPCFIKVILAVCKSQNFCPIISRIRSYSLFIFSDEKNVKHIVADYQHRLRILHSNYIYKKHNR